MVELKFKNGHRWTMLELSKLMKLWQADEPLREIAVEFQTSPNAIRKIVQRLRTNGVPLTRRTKGNVSDRASKKWTQGEVEYLIRRRAENATNEEIGIELGRTENAICGMISKFRIENVPITMRGKGNHRLYNVDALKGLAVSQTLSENITITD